MESLPGADDRDYYRKTRQEIMPFLPEKFDRLLDVGCGEGIFGEAVAKRHPGCEVWGLEPVEAVARKAALRTQHLVNAPFEEASELPSQYFDVVTMNDVLEHMTWPEVALTAARRVLKPDGTLVLSLPNVQYLPHVMNLVVRNDWEYQDYGILDRTHFRFYTTKSAVKLLQDNGFRVERLVGINATRLKWYFRVLIALFPKRFGWMPFVQFVIVARSAG